MAANGLMGIWSSRIVGRTTLIPGVSGEGSKLRTQCE
jgi:hypothetical protein